MSSSCARQTRAAISVDEQDIARRWWALAPGSQLLLSDGRVCRLIFAGCPGGSVGPDVRDAVLWVPLQSQEQAVLFPQQDRLLAKYIGDVEFHVRASDWSAHLHHRDPRYNAVVLHVVFICDDPHPTLRQDGVVVPVCSLYDQPVARTQFPLTMTSQTETTWPCHHVLPLLSKEEIARLLMHAGLLRFEQKAHTFVEQLHCVDQLACSIDTYDLCLLPALAEGLGYGRDRDFFRASGLYLLVGKKEVPEPLGRATRPAPLDASRLRVLAVLIERWRHVGAWQTLRKLFLAFEDTALLQALRTEFCALGLSLARTDILICNVVLPFAAAVALLEHDSTLAERAQACYRQHPGLASNRITRMMCKQLQLPGEPRGSCQQQGLHYIYQQTCQEKHCTLCMMGKSGI